MHGLMNMLGASEYYDSEGARTGTDRHHWHSVFQVNAMKCGNKLVRERKSYNSCT
jgi:hypothetical protein